VLLRPDSGENAQALQGRLQTILGFVDGVASLAAVAPGTPFLVAGKALVGPLGESQDGDHLIEPQKHASNL
jgi:hypothetical protein